MRTVAERLGAGCLATAEPNFLGLLGREQHWREPGSLMRAVAERLLRAAPAGAPEILAPSLHGETVRPLLGGNRFAHDPSLSRLAILISREPRRLVRRPDVAANSIRGSGPAQADEGPRNAAGDG